MENRLDKPRKTAYFTPQPKGGAPMAVPDVAEISSFSVLNGIHTCPGKVWIGELKLVG